MPSVVYLISNQCSFLSVPQISSILLKNMSQGMSGTSAECVECAESEPVVRLLTKYRLGIDTTESALWRTLAMPTHWEPLGSYNKFEQFLRFETRETIVVQIESCPFFRLRNRFVLLFNELNDSSDKTCLQSCIEHWIFESAFSGTVFQSEWRTNHLNRRQIKACPLIYSDYRPNLNF